MLCIELYIYIINKTITKLVTAFGLVLFEESCIEPFPIATISERSKVISPSYQPSMKQKCAGITGKATSSYTFKAWKGTILYTI
jgi:hypothetical protein